ncbi:MAG: rRNA maturation RNase YbeY [Lachnospiraceae bacterium]|nr:rRNA maturation RNase YbeY [Lachnospiraceae bacterium]
MTIQIERECQVELEFPVEEIITLVVEEALSYENCPYDIELNVLLTDNAAIQEINREQRGKDEPTDVLSFPMVEYAAPADFSVVEDCVEEYFNPETGELLLGDIVISVDKVIEQAESYGHSQKRELAFLTAHSMLHLFGYDHIKEAERLVMEEKQREILSNLRIGRG